MRKILIAGVVGVAAATWIWLMPSPTGIRGKLLDENGRPIAGARINRTFLHSVGSTQAVNFTSTWTLQSDEHGVFEDRQVDAGAYSLQAAYPDSKPEKITLKTDRSRVAGIILRAPRQHVLNKDFMDAALHEETTAQAQALLAAGANINAVDYYNGTALSLAILNLRTPAVRFLLQAGADPNLATATEPAPLLAAVERGSLEIVESLVEAGADLAATNRQGQTPLDAAVWKNETEIAAYLRTRGAPGTVTASGPLGCISGIVVDEDGRPPRWGNVDLGRYENNQTNASSYQGMSFSVNGTFSFGNLEKGRYRIRVSDVAHSAQDVSLDSPTSRVENIRLQVTRQEMLDAAFCTAIHFAFNTKELARLLNEGADINAADGQGHSALWHAIRDDNQMAAAFLRERGAAEPETPPE